MSGVILNNLDYLKLLLNTSRLQGEALLDTATPPQIKTISQIVRNLKVISLDKSIVEVLEKRKKLFAALGKKKQEIRVKGKLISRHRKLLLGVLMTVRPVLMGIIGDFEDNSSTEKLEEESIQVSDKN